MTGSSAARGRPRSQSSRDAILAAAFAVLTERGYAGMTFEAVAAAAGAGKTTIYRWWRGKADLAVDAFFHATESRLAFPETGSAREDFRQQVKGVAEMLGGSRGLVLAAMLGGGRTDPDLSRSLGERWLEPRRRWGVARLARAIEDGECREGVTIDAALGVLYGPLYTPLLFGRPVPAGHEVEDHLAIALDAVFRSR